MRPSTRSFSRPSLSYWVPPLDLAIHPTLDLSTLLTFLYVVFKPVFAFLLPGPAITLIVLLAFSELPFTSPWNPSNSDGKLSKTYYWSALMGLPCPSAGVWSCLACWDGVALLTNLCLSIF